MGRRYTRALEIPHADLNLRQAAVVFELRVFVVAHGLDRRRDLPVLHWVFAPGSNRRFFPERCVRVGWVQRVFMVAGVQFYG